MITSDPKRALTKPSWLLAVPGVLGIIAAGVAAAAGTVAGAPHAAPGAASVSPAAPASAAAAAQPPSSVPATPPGPAAPAARSTSTALPPLAPPMTAAQVITVLDQTVAWFRTLGLQQQAATEPSDLLILYDNRQTANKVLSLAFDIARANADLLGKEPLAADEATDDATSSQALQQLQKKLDAQGVTIQAELEADRRAPVTSAKAGVELRAKINELQGELDLVNTKKSILSTLTGVTTDGGGSSTGALKSQIDAMAVAVPAAGAAGQGTPAAGTAPASAAAPSTAATGTAAATRFGLWDLASNTFRLSEKAATIESIDRRTVALQTTLTQVRNPLLTQIKALSAKGDALAAAADTADSTALNGVHDELDALSEQFKQASALLIPLSRENILLNQYRRNLHNWRDAIKAQYRDVLETLGIRVGILVVILALLFGAAELWRRMVERYIQDSRRRYQLLLLRRIALWSLVVVVIGFAFASELGSIVTFAGLITAGIAVAMQSVLVSIVGYFFLIGKYGIRVGDRVQIGDVAGEVIDLGLVRMYLMELGAKGAMGPTGRVVAFANSVVFQVSSGLFKQIPGVNFRWREVILNLQPGSDYAATKEKLSAALTQALQEFRPEILRQTQEIARTTMSSSTGDAMPQVQLQFAGSVVEAHVRYPVHLQNAGEIDERVTEALAKVILAVDAAAATASSPAAPAATTPPAHG